MSVTTSTNTVAQSVLHVLTDYDLHHSGDPVGCGRLDEPNASHAAVFEHQNPEWWPNDHRRVPDYRPVNRNLDRSQRPDGVNGTERVFIFTMLRGVQLNAVSVSEKNYTSILANRVSFRICLIFGETQGHI